jgi:PqqD family protein of HPr-rel-A system
MQGYGRVPGLITEVVDNEIFVLDPGKGRIHAMNASAAALWQLLEEPAALAELVEDFAAAFPAVSRTKLQRDIEQGLADIRDKGLLRRVSLAG